MIIAFDSASPVPPFEQVRSGLATRITDRSLPVGTKLPTVRALAADLGIAPNTVARAYRELEEAGLIETRGRAGSFVAAAGDQSRRRAQQAAAEYAALTRKLGLADAEALAIARAALDEGKN
ncbi:GntR family transcriptional regulator [Amycolatopsis sp. MEPSY49]|uniref:GntR family transcriptional regulator n=1 Tax=Amycolatopsis sp. MEPSY49 TaxID=3151600 RepID=UPI003EF52A16